MNPIKNCIVNKDTTKNPIWLMRQAGRYLPEFRDIRLKNPNFIKLCLNENLSSEITLQPLKRFDFDAAIIFSDILMLPYGLGQEVNFKKNFGPQLGEIEINNIIKQNSEDFIERLSPVYKSLKITSKDKLLKNKDLIGFVGAPWTLLVYMINKISPKNNFCNLCLSSKVCLWVENHDFLKILKKPSSWTCESEKKVRKLILFKFRIFPKNYDT